MRIDPEDLAAQVDYFAVLGRLIVPRAFAFAGSILDPPQRVSARSDALPLRK